jgi:hypothetical protein
VGDDASEAAAKVDLSGSSVFAAGQTLNDVMRMSGVLHSAGGGGRQ